MMFPALSSPSEAECLLCRCRWSLVNDAAMSMKHLDATALKTNGEVGLGNRLCDSKVITLLSWREAEWSGSKLFQIEVGI